MEKKFVWIILITFVHLNRYSYELCSCIIVIYLSLILVDSKDLNEPREEHNTSK